MSDTPTTSLATVDGTVLQDQIDACDDIVDRILEEHGGKTEMEEDPYEQVYGLYERVRQNSIQAFNDRYQTSALYDVLKALFRKIGEERGYEPLMHYEQRGKHFVADSIDNGVYWFKLYAGVILNTQPEITYEWAVPHFKEHRDLIVSHPNKIQPLGDGPDPTLVSSVVPLWYVLEDVLRLWQKVLKMDPEERKEREYILEGEISHDDGLKKYRYGFIRDLDHRQNRVDVGYITDYQDGENGKGSRFQIDDIDFFPEVGDVVRFRAEQKTRDDGEEYGALTVTETVSLVE